MSKKEQILELARFLDSSHARRVSGADRETVKAIAKLIFELTRERLGKAPAELDGEDVRALLVQLLPERLAPGDSLVAHVPATFVDEECVRLRPSDPTPDGCRFP